MSPSKVMPASLMIQPTVAAIATRECLSSAALNHASVAGVPSSARPAGSQPSGKGLDAPSIMASLPEPGVTAKIAGCHLAVGSEEDKFIGCHLSDEPCDFISMMLPPSSGALGSDTGRNPLCMRSPSIVTNASNPTPIADNVMGALLPLANSFSAAFSSSSLAILGMSRSLILIDGAP